MIITWNTDPSKGAFAPGSGKYSSYYQYDNISKKLVRIRLELGRNEGTGQTKVIFDQNRSVGFSKIDFIKEEATYPDSDFTIDAKTGKLLVKGVAIDGTPQIGDNVVDMSVDSRVPHFGNSVSDKVNLPDGIENKHLSLLANDAIIKETGIDLTLATANGAELSTALKAQVSDIIRKPFTEITDDDLLSKLKSQVTEIKTTSIAPSKDSLDSSLEEVDKLIEDIKNQMTDEGLAPTEKFETAFKDLAIKVVEAKKASASGKGIKDAIVDLAKSKTALNEAASDLSAAHYDVLKDQFMQSDSAIKTAQEDSETWESIDTEYQDAEEATSIEEYEKSIGNEEVEAV